MIAISMPPPPSGTRCYLSPLSRRFVRKAMQHTLVTGALAGAGKERTPQIERNPKGTVVLPENRQVPASSPNSISETGAYAAREPASARPLMPKALPLGRRFNPESCSPYAKDPGQSQTPLVADSPHEVHHLRRHEVPDDTAVKHVFVFGLDDFNRRQLETLRPGGNYRFHELFKHEEVKAQPEFPVKMLLEEGTRRLAEFPGRIDAIVGYWDFPVCTMLPLLRRPYGLPSASFEATLKCEHKFWSRLEQQRVVFKYVPRFCAVDPFTTHQRSQIPLDFPFWIKPLKAASSHLAFKVRNADELTHALGEIRRRIFRFGNPFNYLLQFADLPPEVATVEGNHCIAEADISRGRQCTLEGYVYDGDVQVYGAIDSIREGKHRSSFARYQYPSRLPARVLERMTAVTRRFMSHIDYNNSPFNIEYYWDAGTDRIWLLEVNTRISKSHCPLFKHVDGTYHHQVMVDVALGRRPDFPYREGKYRFAGKFMWRTYEDAVVTRVPTPDELDDLCRRIDGVEVQLHVREGTRLSELPDQDSYSYEVAVIFLGANSQTKLLQKYRDCQEAMHLRFDTVH